MVNNQAVITIKGADGQEVTVTRGHLINIMQEHSFPLFGLSVNAIIAFVRLLDVRGVPLNHREPEDIRREFSK